MTHLTSACRASVATFRLPHVSDATLAAILNEFSHTHTHTSNAASHGLLSPSAMQRSNCTRSAAGDSGVPSWCAVETK